MREVRQRPGQAAAQHDQREDAGQHAGQQARGGYEIVDKFARKEIYLEGALAQNFREGVEELARGEPTQDQVEEFIGRYTGLPQQPLILH